MWRLPAVLGVLATTVVVALGVAPAERATAGHAGQNCGIVSKGSRDYRVRAQQLSCKAARSGVLLYLRKHEARPGFKCGPLPGRTLFYCKNGAKVYWAVKL